MAYPKVFNAFEGAAKSGKSFLTHANNAVHGAFGRVEGSVGNSGANLVEEAARAGRAGARTLRGSLKKYDDIVNSSVKLDSEGKINDIKFAAGGIAVAAPVAGVGYALASAGDPSYRPNHDYGSFMNNNAATGSVDISQMGSYDVGRSTEYARLSGMIKKSGWDSDSNGWDKTASWFSPIANVAEHGVGNVATMGKDFATKITGALPKKKAFFENPKVLLSAGGAMGAYASAGEIGAAKRVQNQNVNTYLNLPSQVPQL